MKAKVALIVAIVLGVVAAWGVRSYINKEVTAVKTQLDEYEVVAVKERIIRGEPIGVNQLTSKKLPRNAVTRDHILWRDGGRLVREKLDRHLEAGEIILWSYVQREVQRVTTVLPPGEVALTLRVDDVSGVAGTLRPGSHVDVYATLSVPRGGAGSGGEVVTRRILANVTVLAVDNRTAATQGSLNPYGRGMQPYSTVTVSATPDEAPLLIFIQAQGQMTLTLRNATDIVEGTENPPEVSLQSVLRISEQLDRARKARQAGPAVGGTE